MAEIVESEMVERIARAICAGQHHPEHYWPVYRNHAGLVLEAMREPRQNQLAAVEAWVERDSLDQGDCAPADVWRRMIIAETPTF